MKTIKYIIFIMAVVTFASCVKEKLLMFDDVNDNNKLEFIEDEEVVQSFTNKFTFPKIENKDADTVFLKIRIIGNLSNKDRSIRIEQIIEKDKNGKDLKYTAKPGVHYIAFDNDELKKHFVIKANKVIAKIPIVLFRDASLKDATYRLKVKIVKNDLFELAEQTSINRIIIFSDIYIKPTKWDELEIQWYWGEYGQKKHQFMEKVIKRKIDNNFINSLFDFEYGYPIADFGSMLYYIKKFNKALNKHNAEHPNNLLREKAEEGETEGRLVEFIDPEDLLY